MRSVRAIALAACVTLTIGVGVRTASADINDDKRKIDSAVAEAGDDLENANAAVAAAIKQLNEAKEELPGARAALTSAREAADAAAEADRKAQLELDQANAAAIRAEQERQEVAFQIEDLQSRVGNLAREVYQNGAFADFDLMITAGSPTELADRAAALTAVSRVNNQTLSKMGEVRAELALKQARLEVLRQQVDEKRQQAAISLKESNIARDQAAQAKAKVDLLVSKKATALNVASANRASVLAQYKSVQAEQERIAALLAKAAAEEAARVAAGGKPTGGTGSGGLLWPIAGARVNQGVGARVHPVYGYRSCHTGVDLGASSGTPIRATAAGEVISTASGGPYGNHTLIMHAGGIFSMYAHQSRFGVRAGQKVKAGQVIGYVGSTGYSTGPHLHFEIHVGSVPYDPMGWFGGSKTKVSCA